MALRVLLKPFLKPFLKPLNLTRAQPVFYPNLLPVPNVDRGGGNIFRPFS